MRVGWLLYISFQETSYANCMKRAGLFRKLNVVGESVALIITLILKSFVNK